MRCACGQYEVPSELVPAQLRDGVFHMAPQMTPEGNPLLCEIAILRTRAEKAEALADRMAEAGAKVAQELSTARVAFMGGPDLDSEDPEGALALADWNAALRAWEEARRG